MNCLSESDFLLSCTICLSIIKGGWTTPLNFSCPPINPNGMCGLIEAMPFLNEFLDQFFFFNGIYNWRAILNGKLTPTLIIASSFSCECVILETIYFIFVIICVNLGLIYRLTVIYVNRPEIETFNRVIDAGHFNLL